MGRSEGFEFDEALRLGLVEPEMSRATSTCATFASRHVKMSAQRRLNGHDMPPIVGEKLGFALQHRRARTDVHAQRGGVGAVRQVLVADIQGPPMQGGHAPSV